MSADFFLNLRHNINVITHELLQYCTIFVFTDIFILFYYPTRTHRFREWLGDLAQSEDGLCAHNERLAFVLNGALN